MEVATVRPQITDFVRKVAEAQNIPNYTITNIQTNPKGEGFLGEIFMVTIKDQKSPQQLDILIKAAFADEKIRKTAPVRISFESEVHFYSTLYPAFTQFEQKATTHHHPHRHLIPECFLASLDQDSEMLALENLKVAGFEHVDKAAMLGDEHFRLIFDNYGRFHAYSFALRHNQPQKYREIVEKLMERDALTEFLTIDYFTGHTTFLVDFIRSSLVQGEDDRIIEKFSRYCDGKSIGLLAESLRSDCDYPAIVHGDCHSNNMFFKYQNSNGKRTLAEMRLIDFQLIKVGSPVCDLSYCLYAGASKTEFDKLDEYLDVYHKSFTAFLKQLGISEPSDELFSLAALKAEWKKYAKFGLLMAINVIKIRLTEEAEHTDLTDIGDGDEEVTFTRNKFDEAEFLRRSRAILEHLIEIDAL